MVRGILSLVIVTGIAITLLLSSAIEAQPLSKRIGNKSLSERTHQTLIPFDYSNYKKVGPFSRNVYTRIREKTENSKNVFANGNQNFFLKQKRHSASLTTDNEFTLSKKRSVKNFFLDGKRHQ
ncbi:MAG: hypothetical protein IPM56_04330 [Ignavibacteriales bacterium]|nr:MAG: hypothetical protein IPM56_04330 [Ignavibacteriales bacterium]